jgi:hypothetical protein
VVEAFLAVSPWRTLAFLVIAIALGTYIYRVEKPRIEEEAAPDRFVSFEADEVQELRLSYPDSTSLKLSRESGEWMLLEPTIAPADDNAVTGLVNRIVGVTADRRISMDDVESLETYGLEGDGEQARLSILLKDGSEPPDIIVGGTTPVGYQAFSRLEGADEIVVTPLIFHTGVKKTAFELRDKSLFEIVPQSVIAATLTNGEQTISVTRAGDAWTLIEPVQDDADRQQIEGLIAAMNSMAALEFHDDPSALEAPGFDSPTLSFSLETAEGDNHGFTLGKRIAGPAPGHYLRRDEDGLVVKVGETVRVHFDRDTNALRDKQLFKCSADQITHIEFDRSDGEGFELDLGADGKWQVNPMPPDSLVREGIIKRTRGGLATLEATEIVAESAQTPEERRPFNLDTPQIVVTLTGAGETPCGRVLASVLDPDSETPRHYVVREGSPIVLTLPAYHYSRLDARRNDFVATTQNDE